MKSDTNHPHFIPILTSLPAGPAQGPTRCSPGRRLDHEETAMHKARRLIPMLITASLDGAASFDTTPRGN